MGQVVYLEAYRNPLRATPSEEAAEIEIDEHNRRREKDFLEQRARMAALVELLESARNDLLKLQGKARGSHAPTP